MYHLIVFRRVSFCVGIEHVQNKFSDSVRIA